MTAILLTGMSGTGKSTVITELSHRGFEAVDTDYHGYIERAEAHDAQNASEPMWREDKITNLLDQARSGPLFVSGCVANQHRFYPRFAAVVLLSAPLETVHQRVSTRTNNAFGHTDEDRARIAADLQDIEPLLRADATAEIDTRLPLGNVVAQVIAFVSH